MKGDLVIAADFGTSGVKVGVVDRDLTLLARATEPYPLHLGPDGQAEQAPDDWWAALQRAVAKLHDAVPDLGKRVGALVFCAQACGVVCVDADGTPLRPCLTWLDKRSAETGQRLVGGFPSVRGYRWDKGLLWLALANGAPAQNGMDPTAKILWLRDNEPEIFARSRWFLDVRDWLVHRATSVFSTGPESANLTWVMNTIPGREGWSPTLTRLTGIPMEKLPPIVQGEDSVGQLTAQAAAELGLEGNVHMVAGASDVTAAALGTGSVADGTLHISVATSAWIAGFFPGRRVSIPHAFATITSGLNHRPLLIASQENAGSALDWAGQITGVNVSEGGFDGLGPVQADDPVFMPWLTGERVPADDPRLRGTFHGLALHHDGKAMRRAAMEGVAQNLRWAYSKVSRVRGAQSAGPIALVGGAAANPEFAQMLADTLDRDIRVGASRHAGVLGAASLAAQTMGWASDACASAAPLATRDQITYRPQKEQAALLSLRAARLKKIRRDVIRSYGRHA